MRLNYAYYRFRQYLLGRMQRLLPWRMPEVISGIGSIRKIPEKLQEEHIYKVLLLTTAGTIKRGSLDGLLEDLKKKNIVCVIYDQVKPDPAIEGIEEAVDIYRKGMCEAIIAVGGGSVLDCAKVVGARIVKPEQSVLQMTGMFKIRKKLPPLYAVPTTAGTGSEVTVAAVVTDSIHHYKYPINDLCLIPAYAVLDPQLTCDMPKSLTAATGMDALTHAVEAYINRYGSKESKAYARNAVRLIFENLLEAYQNGNNVEIRDKMLTASYEAGAAFTKAYVGYVHAIAHGVGGLYGIPHGFANAVILPVVLEAYGTAVYGELSELAEVIGIEGQTQQEKAEKFIQAVKNLNRQMEIPDKLNVIKEEDVAELSRRALREANPFYPVPVIWDETRMKKVMKQI